MVQNIKELGAELNIERLGNPPDRVVLEKRKVQVRQARSYQDVPARIPGQVDAGRKRKLMVAVCGVESRAWSCGHSEALGFDVVEAPGIN